MPNPYPHHIGILGGGQLARMTIMAAQRLGLRCLTLDPAPHTPASQIAPHLAAPLDDPEAIAQILLTCEKITLENEFVPAQAIAQALELAQRDPACLTPGIQTLATVQDKLLQREAYARHGAPSPDAIPLDPQNPHAAPQALGYPLVLKTRFGGYDGKGTRTARTPEEFEALIPLLAAPTSPQNPGWLAETFVPFQRELAVIVARSPQETRCFPTMETIQTNHVCDLVFPALADAAETAIAAVEAVQGYGLFGVELFELPNGQVLVNEIAPRPHNTGHYTLDWGGPSQFEQHVRLTLGLPLLEPVGTETCMANLLGQPDPQDPYPALLAASQTHPRARFHWYAKAESRPGRKMGHLNVTGPGAVPIAQKARETFYRLWTSSTA